MSINSLIRHHVAARPQVLDQNEGQLNAVTITCNPKQPPKQLHQEYDRVNLSLTRQDSKLWISTLLGGDIITIVSWFGALYIIELLTIVVNVKGGLVTQRVA